MERRLFIARDEIWCIEPHATLHYWLIVLADEKGTWYAKSFTIDLKGVHGEFYSDRF